VTDENDLWADDEEPSLEDFFADEYDEQPPSPWAPVLRALRVVGTLVLVVALLLYFVVPFRTAILEAWSHWRPPVVRMRTIPLAPEPTGTVKLRV
jgi:hypothetical protein